MMARFPELTENDLNCLIGLKKTAITLRKQLALLQTFFPQYLEHVEEKRSTKRSFLRRKKLAAVLHRSQAG